MLLSLLKKELCLNFFINNKIQNVVEEKSELRTTATAVL